MNADILIVDDTPANLDLLSNILKERNYKVRAVPDGQLAIKSSLLRPPDLILLDVTMPGMDGYQVCQRIKSEEKLKDIPILFISALSETDKKIEAFKKGGVDYITKPFQVEEVLARVETHLKIQSLVEEQKKNIEEINNNYKKLKDLEELKDGLVHMIIHDLRTPLFGISAYLELLLENKEICSKDDTFKYLTMSYQSTKTLGSMINNLLDVSKLENHSFNLTKKECNLNEIISNSYIHLEPLFEQKELLLEFPKNRVVTYCDEDLITRIIMNLMSNSIKFSPNQNTIKINYYNKSSNTHFEIIDHGPGIAKENSLKVFNKFYQIQNESQKKIPSTGLGLTFCKLAIEAHNGAIGVESDIGRGCKFWFQIPNSPES